MQAFAADIDMGLRAWPTTPLEAERPLGVVHFYFFTYASAPDYTFQFGKPLRLRNVSPSARWQKRKVMHRVMWGGPEEPREFSAMVRDDGVQLIRIPTSRGPENDGPDLSFHASDTSFDFTAGRHFAIEVVTDTWEVRLNPSYRSGFTSALRARLGPARCSEIVHTIEDGLFAWIPEPYEERQRQVPVNRVVFLDAECSDR
jgi:hypothetical protein